MKESEVLDFEKIFIEQYGDLPTGGFLNPTVEHDDGKDILFRCHYDNYDTEEDAWHYGFNISTGRFYTA